MQETRPSSDNLHDAEFKDVAFDEAAMKNVNLETPIDQASSSKEPSVVLNETIAGPQERHSFKAETRRLLEIVANSLYSEKEIFIRELTSNAADACEKMKYFQLSRPDDLEPLAEGQNVGIHISLDKEKGLFVIKDFGIGMSKEELEENLGTIALSGAGKFLKQASENKNAAVASGKNIIGQFGVGFYSAFTVGTKVDVYSRSAFKGSKGYCWSSDGLGDFTLAEADNVEVGTKLVVHLKPEDKEYSEAVRVEAIVKKYSNFVGFPVFLNGKQVNTIQPLWTMDKASISTEQYNDFYRFVADSFEDPLYRLHYSTDAPVQIRSLLFVPKRAPMQGFQPDDASDEGKISLYSKKVLIKGKTKDLLPKWLSFVHGVVESEDIPLNLSRELLQNNMLIQKIKRVLTGRIVKWFQEEQKRDPLAYSQFYRKFAVFFKGGILSADEGKQDIMNLLLFETSYSGDQPGMMASLKDYVSKMKEDQKEIYVCLAKNRETALASPYYEPFEKRGLPVLFSYDVMDEFLVGALGEYEGFKFVRIEDAKIKADVDANSSSADGQQATVLTPEQSEALTTWFSSVLGTQLVKSVKMTERFMSHPGLIVDHAMHSMTMKYFKQMMAAQGGGEDDPSSNMNAFKNPPVDLELNPKHPVIQKLLSIKESQPELAVLIAQQIFDNALIQAGLWEDAQPTVTRINSLLTTLISKLE